MKIARSFVWEFFTLKIFSDKGKVREAVEHAISKGYRNVDAAWIYGNEGEVGEAIEAKINDGTVKREDLFVATKERLHN